MADSGDTNTGPTSTEHRADIILRNILGANLQTGALRAILLLAAFSFIGALFAFLVV